MKLHKFRIQNYKSIIDSGDCYVDNMVTILAGKNESGKTSILEALEDFSVNGTIGQKAMPLHQSKDSDDSLAPKICATFTLNENTKNELARAFGVYAPALNDNDIEILKGFNDEYVFGPKTFEAIKDIAPDSDNESFDSAWNSLIRIVSSKNKQAGDRLRELNDSNLGDLQDGFSDFVKSTIENSANLFGENVGEEFSNNLSAPLKSIEGKIEEFDELIENVKQYIPNFILFSSFDDHLPNSVAFSDFDTNAWIKDLSLASDLDTEVIKNSDVTTKKNHKTQVNINIRDDYKQFWTQDISNLSVDWDSNTLYFWINENDYEYQPSTRSKGRQWHLSFYTKISARAKENVSNIIMIDEPGLYLHAKAQEDILKKLEDSAANESQVIFSTHSPYLLESGKLDRIRLIRKENIAGTKIENKVHALADKETLTPILTAIGLDLGSSILTHDKIKNVVVEGISDVHYLNAFKELMKFAQDINFVCAGGSGNMSYIGTILHGWGGQVVYLFDNDKGKKDGGRKLQKDFGVSHDLIITIVEEGESIEDIFSHGDFKKFVLPDATNAKSMRNSQYVNDKNENKWLLAKSFLESCRSKGGVALDATTTTRVEAAFKKIEDAFRSHETVAEQQASTPPAKKKVVAKKTPKKN